MRQPLLLQQGQRERQQRHDFLRYQLETMASLQLAEGEVAALEAEHFRGGAGEKPPRGQALGDAPAGLEEPWGGLSRRETEVLALLAQRLSGKEIAERLGLSPDTVKTYPRTLYRKLGANGRRDAVARALTAGLIPPWS